MELKGQSKGGTTQLSKAPKQSSGGGGMNLNFDRSSDTNSKTMTSARSPIHKMTTTTIGGQAKISIEDMKDIILQNILTFLNVKDLCKITRVCKKWKRIITRDPDIYSIVNLAILPPSVKTLNLMKIVQNDRNIRKMYLPHQANSNDTNYLLMSIPKTLEFLQINNVNIEFATVFTQKIESLKALELQNRNKRKKILDENEIKAILSSFPNIESLTMNKSPINDSILSYMLPQFVHLKILHMPNSPKLTNETLNIIATNCFSICDLHLGGMATNYNMNFSLEGFEHFSASKVILTSLKLDFCSRIGDSVVSIVAKRFNVHLKSLQIIRNCFEKSAKISDVAFASLAANCPNLESLNITYSRKLRDQFHLSIANHLSKLQFLSLKECPVQEDLSVLVKGCPLLEEVNLSGDSWVTAHSLVGLSKHPHLKRLHLGHYEHGDTSCDENLEEYPPKGMFIEGIFKNKAAFPRLHLLFLEQNCSLTYWLDVRLQKIRPKLTIRYTSAQNVFSQHE